jgi:hypothetical protein
MAIKVKQYVDGSMGLVGSQSDTAGDGFIVVSSEWNASSVDKAFFVAARPLKIVSIIARVTAAGTNGSAVTAEIKKAASGTAITSGTVLHSGTINLKGTANTNQALTLAAAAGTVAAGSCIGVDFAGTLTDATGVVTVTMAPL